MNVLFVCSRNKWRSLTAEEIYKHFPQHRVKSVGTAESARIKLNEKHLIWSDIVFVMERKHKQIIKEKLGHSIKEMTIIVLDIPDIYPYMDSKLIEVLNDKVSGYL
ncbi:low molecular weight protein tyrosine phosphatase family protein [Pedobacter sp. MW01-1-1]|uniref:low molecular weight protein tyrosine phosphatase family protein n=1 Tax=Pedobacter sp. MW01-1-1 TaxID=3383027 RepID=UPI003FEDD66B